MFPVFRRFHGGKGVATGSGVLLIVQPILAPLGLGLWWIVTKATGKAAIGSLVALALVPVGLIVLEKPAWEFLAVAGLCALILLRHAGNIIRLMRGEEHSLGQQ